jgi:hypothetical protein
MKKHIYGRIWGVLQLGFWVIMIPWTILSVPIDLYAEHHAVAPWLQQIFALPWVDWRIGVVIISTFLCLLVAIGLIWTGWMQMHPIANHNGNSVHEEALQRINAVNSFSKAAYLDSIRRQAHEYALARKKKRESK